MGDPKRVADILLRLSGVLFAIFSICIVLDCLPLKLTSPQWHFIFASSLVNFVTIPLIAYGLVHLAYYLTPTLRIEKLLAQLGKLARLAALGFALLVPLLIYSGFVNANQVLEGNARQRQVTRSNVALIDKAIRDSSSAKELQAQMVALKGPRIADDALQIPLPILKNQVQSAVKQAVATIESQFRNPLSSEYLPFYKQYLRTALLALVSAFGFATMAWWPNVSPLLLPWASLSGKTPLGRSKLTAAFESMIQSIMKALEARSRQAQAKKAWKIMKDSQRIAQLQKDKDLKRNEAEMRKHRDRLRRQEILRKKRKNSEE